jgi:hypothetical protein
MNSVTYSTLNAIGYAEATGQPPALIREKTAQELRKLQKNGQFKNLAKRSRLGKAIHYLIERGYKPLPEKSTIGKVLLESAKGLEAFANIKGEAVVKGRVQKRFLNG